MRLRHPEPKKARIEIIPMIDTVFFLLVFFMIASLAMTKMTGVPVQLPASAAGQARPAAKVMVTVTAAGHYYIDKQAVTFSEIHDEIRQRLQGNPQLVVILNCDKSQRVDRLIQVMDEVKRARAENVLIATEPRATAGGGVIQ